MLWSYNFYLSLVSKLIFLSFWIISGGIIVFFIYTLLSNYGLRIKEDNPILFIIIQAHSRIKTSWV